MTLQRMKDQSGQWACEKLQQALHNPDGPNITIEPIDAVGVHAILVVLHNSVDRDEGLPLRDISVDSAGDRLNILLEDIGRTAAHPSHVSAVVRRFMAAIAELDYGPSGWELNVFVVPAGGNSEVAVRMQHLQLTDWRVLEHDK